MSIRINLRKSGRLQPRHNIVGLRSGLVLAAVLALVLAASFPGPAPAQAPSGLGGRCEADRDCGDTDRFQCANGRFCAPRDGTGQPARDGRRADYCHHNNHCVTGVCECQGQKEWGFCKEYESGSNPGMCVDVGSIPTGEFCNGNDECRSRHCAEGVCVPQDTFGITGDYCHHGNHCSSRQCECTAGGPVERSFCPEDVRTIRQITSTGVSYPRCQ